MSVLNLLNPSATVEQEPLFRCHNCKHRKTRDEFLLYKKNTKHGVQGEPSTRCSSCAVTERETRQLKKRKRDEEGIDLTGDPPQPDWSISIEQFMTLLREKALTSIISWSTHVSTQGLVGNADEMCAAIVGCVWEATGFRFTYGWLPLEREFLVLIPFN